MTFTALSDGSSTFVNKRWTEYTGLSVEQSSGTGWQRAIHPEDGVRHSEKWRISVAAGQLFEDEARFRHAADGGYRWFLVRGVPLRGPHGKIVKWYGTLTDIEDRKRAEEALRSSEQRFRLIVDSIPGLVCTMSATGEAQLLNRQVLEYFGKSPEELKNWATSDAVHPDDLPRVISAWASSIETGHPYDIEHRCRRGDGIYRWFQVRALPLRDAESRITGWYNLLTDIDDRKRAEEALQRSQFYISEGQRVAHMGSWAFNAAGFEYWSSELFRIHGLEPSGKPPTVEEYLALVHPEDRAFMKQGITNMLADHRAFDFTKRIVRRDGEIRSVRCVGVPVTQGGIFRGFLGTGMDVTDQERLTEELRRSEGHLAEAQKLTHTASWAWSFTERKAVHLSQEWYRIYGFDPAEGAPTLEEYSESVHPEDRADWKGITERAIAEKADYDQEFRILLPNGKVRWIQTVGHPVLSNTGDLEGFAGSSTDITELKRAEQEREKLRQIEADLAHIDRVSTLGEMAASLAHEIKQPIAAAITSANTCIEWLAHEPPNLDRARAAAARIDKYGNRAAEIIDRIRSLYKNSPPQRELVDVNGIVHEIFPLLQGEAIRYSIAIRPELAAELPKIKADRVQLQQVFMNLMLNAIEAMKDSGGELTVKSELQDGQVQFSVSDTGVGLPMEKMDQIFSAFFTTKPQGSGMGLAISRSIVESHGGRLWATANDGRGAIFHFTLPTEVTESPP
jgi:PAS domain S-box-containing protein